ncbi:hypothetical protein ASPZODRAFT_1246996 [Penicilliopsis zonata CBS 506.65]|uniref:Uncharacterized protein n=1 Tax=Penicilliopsis zonata CBS 506.65 TaxID=1073090 RepID=A0A1L9S745_9EURO|nr:hypothetical protein ASPZODRAFT_1246996 [Penicilliopsis zonata CBS 506.65]OJJ42968.1 hypothetical protein ASPZODRAFT_1246996 [Penicilliopsis zonata CBS 506.65]
MACQGLLPGGVGKGIKARTRLPSILISDHQAQESPSQLSKPANQSLFFVLQQINPPFHPSTFLHSLNRFPHMVISPRQCATVLCFWVDTNLELLRCKLGSSLGVVLRHVVIEVERSYLV